MAAPPTAKRSDEADARAHPQRAAIANALLAYVKENPDACDTLEGIRMWWLRDVQADEQDIEDVLEDMVQKGSIQRIRLAGDVVVHRVIASPKADSGADGETKSDPG